MREMRLYNRNGTWYVGFKRGISRSLKTKDESVAKKIYKELQTERIRNQLINIEKAELKLFDDFKTEYLESRKTMKKNTQRADRLALTKFSEFYGNKPLKGISIKKLDEFRNFLKIAGYENTTCNCHMRHFKKAIKTAIRWGYILKSPLDGFSLFKVDHRKPVYMSIEDVKRLLIAAHEHSKEMETAIAVQYFTAMGRAEIMSQFSVSETTITYRRVKTGKLIVTPIAEELKPYIAHLGQGIRRLFTWKNPRTYSKHFAEIAKRAGLPDISPHKVRHTFATHLLDAGEDIKTISELMGHSSIHVTSEFYAHLTEEKKKRTINKLRLIS